MMSRDISNGAQLLSAECLWAHRCVRFTGPTSALMDAGSPGLGLCSVIRKPLQLSEVLSARCAFRQPFTFNQFLPLTLRRSLQTARSWALLF